MGRLRKRSAVKVEPRTHLEWSEDPAVCGYAEICGARHESRTRGHDLRIPILKSIYDLEENLAGVVF